VKEGTGGGEKHIEGESRKLMARAVSFVDGERTPTKGEGKKKKKKGQNRKGVKKLRRK